MTGMLKSTLALYVAALSWMITLLGYSYGWSDHLEHLPMVFRAMDADYLSQDSFVEATAVNETFNPRYYYIQFLAALGHLLPLPFWALLLTFLGNWAIAWAAARMALYFYKNRTVAFIAALFCLALPVPSFGSTDSLQADYLLQDYLSFAVFVHALVDGLQKKYRRMGLLLFISALLHPLMGLVLGGLHLALLIVVDRRIWRNLDYGLAILLFGLAALAQLWPYAQQTGERLSDSEFLSIYVHFRNPHHFLASHFLRPERIQAAWRAAAVLVLGLAYLFRRSWQAIHVWLFVWLLALAALALGGYYFVEVWPSRLWATVQGFRFLLLAKWWMLILAAGIVAPLVRRGPRSLLLIPFVFAAAHLAVLPYLLAGTLVYLYLEKFFLPNYKIAALLAVAMLGWCYWESRAMLSQSSQLETWWIWSGLSLSLLALSYKRNWVRGLWLFAMAAQLFFWLTSPRHEVEGEFTKKWARQYNLTDQQNAFTKLARFITKNTPKDAILLTPPGFSPLRLQAERAIVVDFKTYAFTDAAMKVWYERILDVYGPAHSKGFEALRYNFVPNYKGYSKKELRELAQKYGAHYIIGYQEQDLPGKLLFETSAYKITRISF